MLMAFPIGGSTNQWASRPMESLIRGYVSTSRRSRPQSLDGSMVTIPSVSAPSSRLLRRNALALSNDATRRIPRANDDLLRVHDAEWSACARHQLLPETLPALLDIN